MGIELGLDEIAFLAVADDLSSLGYAEHVLMARHTSTRENLSRAFRHPSPLGDSYLPILRY